MSQNNTLNSPSQNCPGAQEDQGHGVVLHIQEEVPGTNNDPSNQKKFISNISVYQKESFQRFFESYPTVDPSAIFGGVGTSQTWGTFLGDTQHVNLLIGCQ